MKLFLKIILLIVLLSIPEYLPYTIAIRIQILILCLIVPLLIIILLGCKDLNLFCIPKRLKNNAENNLDDVKYNHVLYNGVDVHYTTKLNGGGILLSYEFTRLVSQEIGKVHHVFEYCAGPGFIGFNLLANNLCEKLTLADINPTAINAINATIAANGLQDRVTVYQSNCLDSIPKNEQWDLVVGNPPWHIRAKNNNNIILSDAKNRIHQSFFENIHNFLRPEASILFVEAHEYTQVKHFNDLIKKNHLTIAKYFPPVSILKIFAHLNEYQKISLSVKIFLRFGIFFREIYFLHIKSAVKSI